VASALEASSFSSYYDAAIKSASLASGLSSFASILSAYNASVHTTTALPSTSTRITNATASVAFAGTSTAGVMTILPAGPLLTATGTPTPHRMTLTTTLVVSASTSDEGTSRTSPTAATSSLLPNIYSGSDVGKAFDSSLALAFGVVVAVAFLG